MRSLTRKAHLFLVAFAFVLIGSSTEMLAQGKGRGGDNRGGGRPAEQPRQQPQAQRPQPQAQRQQPQQRMERPQPQRQMPQIQRQMPQMNRQAQRPQPQRMERPQQQRQMPQMDRQAQRPQPQRMERPQQQRQMPQMDRQAQRPQPQRMERPQQQRQMPQMDRQAQRPQKMERQQRQMPQIRREMPQVDRQAQRSDKLDRQRQMPQARDEAVRVDRGRSARMEKQLPGMSRPEIRSSEMNDRRSGRNSSEAPRTFERPNTRDSFVERSLRNSYSNEERVWDRASKTDYRLFDDRERQLRRQARYEGRAFSTQGFQDSVYAYNQREAWRDNIFRTVISVNLGYGDGRYYAPPPSYVNYYDVSYDPRFYNVGYSYYDPYYSSVYVEPYSYAYQPYDAYYGSYYYDDPYDLGDPYDDYLTYQVVGSSGSVGGFVTRILSNLISYGYEQGYRDGLLARQTGYVEEYYDDPYDYDVAPYQTVSYYEPYSVNAYENRRCLSEGYDLGYRDALYGEATGYVPEYRGGDLVTLWIGSTYSIV